MRFTPYRFAFEPPLITAQGVFAERTGWRLDSHGGCGDVAPWPGFGAGRAAVAADVERAVPQTPEVLGALATARAVGAASAAGRPLAEWLHPQAARSVESHVLADAAPAGAILKLKVGAGALAEDVARVAAVRAAWPKARLRLDANGAWRGDAAVRAVRALAAFEPEWIEQPVPPGDLAALRALRAWAPIMADESVTDAGALEALLAAEAVHGVVIKPAFVGGAAVAFELGQRARAAGLMICVTHALGSAVDRWVAVHVACALAADGPVAAGLGGPAVGGGPALVQGWVQRSNVPGLEGL